MKAFKTAIGVCTLALMIGACGPSQEVQRVETDKVTDYSAKWNDTDARLVAEKLTSSILNGGWLTRSKEGRPVVIVGHIRNETMEHIQTDLFIKELEQALVNSGQVSIVADPQQRKQIRAERTDQQKHASYESAASLAKEMGADYMLLGNINASVDKNLDGTKAAKFYRVNLELIDVETNNKVWLDSKEIKKTVARKKVKW